MKRCKDCGQLLPLDTFYKMKGMRDGHRNECKTCFAARRRRWYEAHRDEEIARVKAWQQANPAAKTTAP